MSDSPQPVDRKTLALALFAFGLINLAVVLFFADAVAKRTAFILLLFGLLCAVPAWIRLRRM